MDHVRIYHTRTCCELRLWNRRHVGQTTAIFREDITRWQKGPNHWRLDGLIFFEWQRVYETQGRYFTGD
jgi:hypothetical protein